MVKLIKWIGVSESFKRLKHFVSPYETLCFITWNTLFQGMELILELFFIHHFNSSSFKLAFSRKNGRLRC